MPPVSGAPPRINISPKDYVDAKIDAQNTQPAPPAQPPTQQSVDSFDDGTKVPVKPTNTQMIEDGRLNPKGSWSDLPKDLQNKIEPEVWNSLREKGQTTNVVALYQELKAAGLWGDIKAITGEREAKEPKVDLPGGYQTEVKGNSGDLQYKLNTTTDKFREKLLKLNPNFGIDGSIMSALHGGQLSMRQSGTPHSVHISLGPGKDQMDAHIDVVNPVNTPKNRGTQVDPQRGAEHWQTEVGPEKLRKGFAPFTGMIPRPKLHGGTRGEPGASGPDWEPNGRKKGELTIMASWEFRGLSKKKDPVKNEHRNGEYYVSEKAAKNIEEKVGKMKLDFPKLDPKLYAGNDIDPKAVAADLAVRMTEAAKKGERITIDLPEYAGQPKLQKQMLAELEKVAKMVRSELKADGVDVSGNTAMTVTFGKKNAKDTYAKEGGTIPFD